MPIPSSFSKKKKEEAIQGAIMPSTRPDLDNIIKTAMDALQGDDGPIPDDAHIIAIQAIKRYSINPALMIAIQKYTPKTKRKC